MFTHRNCIFLPSKETIVVILSKLILAVRIRASGRGENFVEGDLDQKRSTASSCRSKETPGSIEEETVKVAVALFTLKVGAMWIVKDMVSLH